MGALMSSTTIAAAEAAAIPAGVVPDLALAKTSPANGPTQDDDHSLPHRAFGQFPGARFSGQDGDG